MEALLAIERWLVVGGARPHPNPLPCGGEGTVTLRCLYVLLEEQAGLT